MLMTQLYIVINPDYSSQLSNLENCLAEIKTWLSVNFLLLNADKTELLIIKSSKHKHIFENLTITLDGCKISQSPTVKNLGVIFDPSLSFQTHIKAITKTAFFHLCNISKIRPILTMTDAEILIHAFVSSRSDYCNVLFSSLPKTTIKSLQLVQNAAARILTKTRKYDHITPILSSLHWLPVHIRSDFNLLLLTYKALHGSAPSYLTNLVTPYTPARTLRSQDARILAVPRF